MFKRTAFAFGVVAMGMSGAYLFIYLYRWEWNRAIMAGVFLIAAEIAFVAAAIFDRIKALEKSVAAAEVDSTPRDTLSLIRDNPPPQRDHFAWLDDTENLNVFIPFLMGAGLVASGVAWMIERVAAATARPALERGLAGRLAPISLPLPVAAFTPSPAPTKNGKATVHRQAIALAVAILIGTVGIDILGDATQTRPDVLQGGTRSAIVVDIAVHRAPRGAGEALESLWAVCGATVPNKLVGAKDALGGSLYRISVSPALGKYGERRLRGCLEDATIDNVQGRVVSITT